MKPYLSFNDNSDLLDRAAELIKVDVSLVVDVEELEGLRQERVFALVGGALLEELLAQLCLEAASVTRAKAYSLRRCFFAILISLK